MPQLNEELRTRDLPARRTDEPALAYASYALIVLMVCYTLSFVDRQVLSLLVGPMKRDIGISDAQVGLLQGLAFALFYTTLGIPTRSE